MHDIEHDEKHFEQAHESRNCVVEKHLFKLKSKIKYAVLMLTLLTSLLSLKSLISLMIRMNLTIFKSLSS
jgi:hypothetical protein